MPGLDKKILDQIQPEILLKRIQLDVRTDFILAPHYNAIYVKASNELWARSQELLGSGRYNPKLPLTISVPKGRGFTRPGSILHPIDRVVYHALADLTAPILESQLDRSRTFGQLLTDVNSPNQLFEQTGDSWSKLQIKLSELCEQGGYFVKADVANYFERIPQHHLINLMFASGCQPETVRLLEEILLAFQERESFGIIQGVYPSDLFGNFYLSDFDAFCELHEIPSVRYVDDFYMQFDSYKEAMKGLMSLIDRLRQNGLHLNEYKSGILSAEQIIKEETEIDQLFAKARQELKNERQASYSLNGYGFSIEWELSEDEFENEDEAMDLDAAALIRLYTSIEDFPEQRDKIEKFCLPLLRATASDIAIERSINGILENAHLTRLYMSYLSRFTPSDNKVVKKLEALLVNQDLISDYQRMYLISGLINCKNPSRDTVNTSLQILDEPTYAQELRAIAAIFAAKFGNPQQRRFVRLAYEKETSSYVRSAILYASRHFTNVEHKTCIKAWGGHSTTNTLITQALKAK